jgi:hypothetical protein
MAGTEIDDGPEGWLLSVFCGLGQVAFVCPLSRRLKKKMCVVD